MTVECARVGGINLAQGVCDTPVPEEVRRAAQQAIEEGANLYSRCEGLDELRVGIAGLLERNSGVTYDWESEIVVTNGATGAFYVAALALLDPGDEVIVFEPYYGYHTNTLHSVGAEPRFVTLRAPDWSFTRGDLEAAIGPRTRGIIVNTPANPCGKVFDRGELELIAELARRHDLFVFTDEVYEHFVFDGRRHLSPAAIPGLREHAILISALSKTYSITGWRIGYVAAEARFARLFAPLNDLVYVCAPTPMQLGCARAIEKLPPEYYSGLGAEYQIKRDRLCAALATAGLTPCVPQGSYFVLADISRLPGETGDERAMWLLHETGVASVPGTAFYRGAEGDRLTRFCFGKTDADLDEACHRLEKLSL
jgi:aminotransferase